MARKKRRSGGHRLTRAAYADAVCSSCSTLKRGKSKKKRRKTKHKKSR